MSEHIRSWELVEADEEDLLEGPWLEITRCSCGAFEAEIELSDEDALIVANEGNGPGLALFEQHVNASPTLPLFD